MTSSAARRNIDVGSVIAGTYVLERLLGSGGMGAVYSASHTRLPGKKVAIKLLHAELNDPEVLARFEREAKIATLLGHPNIVTVHDFNVTPEGMPYLVLEYLQGETLAQRLISGPLALESAMSIVRQVGSALAAAHREGIVHRDLKPQNVFLVPTDVDGRMVEIAKVLDFGISKIRGSETVKTLDSALLGTPQYMAPEQATGQHSAVDERTDVFAFGAMVYEMLCGHPAFKGASIPEVVFKVVYEQPESLAEQAPGLSSTIVDAVTHAMQKKAADRCATVNGFVEELTGSPLISGIRPPSTVPAPPSGWASGSRRVENADHKDAFAQTVGSGDHGPAVAAGANTVVSIARPVSENTTELASASTMFPSSAARAEAAVIPASPVDTGAPTVRKSRSPMLFVGLAAGCVIATAVTLFVMRRDHAEPSSPAPVHAALAIDAGSAALAAVTPLDAGSAAAVVAVVAPTDAAVATAPVVAPADASTKLAVVAIASHDAGVPATHKPDPSKLDAGTPLTIPTKPDAAAGNDPEVDEPGDIAEAPEVARIKNAEASLSAGDNDSAMRAANTVLSNSKSRVLKRRAEAIRGIVFCRQSDQEHASASWRAAGGARFRARIERACAQTETTLPNR